MKKKSNENRKKVLIVGISIIFLVSSIASVVLYRNSTQDVNDITLNVSNKMLTFKRVNDYFTTSINNKEASFYTLPYDAETLPVAGGAISTIKNANAVLLTFNPNDKEDLAEIDRVRYDFYVTMPALSKYLGEGVTNGSADYALPVITCQNATAQMPVVELYSSNVTGITQEGNCIRIAGRRFDFLRARDRIFYSLYGIMG